MNKSKRGRPAGKARSHKQPIGSLAEHIRSARIQLGYKLRDVAEVMKVKTQCVSNIESGRCTVPNRCVSALSAFLGIPVAVLFALNIKASAFYKEIVSELRTFHVNNVKDFHLELAYPYATDSIDRIDLDLIRMSEKITQEFEETIRETR